MNFWEFSWTLIYLLILENCWNSAPICSFLQSRGQSKDYCWNFRKPGSNECHICYLIYYSLNKSSLQLPEALNLVAIHFNVLLYLSKSKKVWQSFSLIIHGEKNLISWDSPSNRYIQLTNRWKWTYILYVCLAGCLKVSLPNSPMQKKNTFIQYMNMHHAVKKCIYL